jgi:NitT/TauT family transport system substrate-binding protein
VPVKYRGRKTPDLDLREAETMGRSLYPAPSVTEITNLDSMQGAGYRGTRLPSSRKRECTSPPITGAMVVPRAKSGTVIVINGYRVWTSGSEAPHPLRLSQSDRGRFERPLRRQVDFEVSLVFGSLPRAIETGLPIVAPAGLHIGCFELFAREGIRSAADLKGKSVGLSGAAALLTLMLASVGLDPAKDIRWVSDASKKDRAWAYSVVADPSTPPLELFAAGKIDAFLAGPMPAQELHARRVGHVILNITTDRPWSQYFCCMLVANRDYVRKYPVATKRVLRAILKATDLCGSEPARVAQRLVDGGSTPRYDYAFETLRGIPYDKWREHDPEDSIRFYALRLHEAGLIKSSPNKLIADGTDWRFLTELKRELKA